MHSLLETRTKAIHKNVSQGYHKVRQSLLYFIFEITKPLKNHETIFIKLLKILKPYDLKGQTSIMHIMYLNYVCIHTKFR